MNTTGHVDWFAVTYPASLPAKHIIPDAFAQLLDLKPKGNPQHGYTVRLESILGAWVMLAGPENMGIHAVFPGQALAELRSQGLTDRALCQHAIDNDGRAARLDVTVNLHGANLTVGQIAEAYQKGALKTPARSGLRTSGINEPGDTFYVGKPTSDRRFRAYDKAAEMHIVDGEAWLRLELQCRKVRARMLTTALAEHDNTRAVINRAIGDFAMCTEPEYQAALSDNDATIEGIHRKLGSVPEWLIVQVAPAIARYQVDHPDEDMLAILQTEVKRRMEVLANTAASKP